MTVYNNANPHSDIAALEQAIIGNDSFLFLQLRSSADTASVVEWARAAGWGVIASTTLNGQPLIVARGTQTTGDVLDRLSKRGDVFIADVPKKKFQGWAWRGALSIVGQALDIFSVYLASKNKSRTLADNAAYLTFALANVGASIINIVFGAKKIEDVNRTRFLKERVSTTLQPHVDSASLPSPDAALPEDLAAENAKGWGSKLYGFVRSHSVYVDMGLRYFGNTNLIFSVKNLTKPGWQKLNNNPYSVASGISLFIGKTVTAFSRVPDPYSKEPATAWQHFREKYTFRLGNMLESFSAIFMGYNSFRGNIINGVRKSNPVAGVANILFMFGYIARWFAPFGVREINLDSIKNYAREPLKKAPAEKRLQLIADVSAAIKSDLKDQPITFGELYAKIFQDVSSAAQSEPIITEDAVEFSETRRRPFARDAVSSFAKYAELPKGSKVSQRA